MPPMSGPTSLARALARRLPGPIRGRLRRALPARIVDAPRRFVTPLPAPPPGLGGVVRPVAVPARIRIEAPRASYVPRLLERSGLAGYEPETVAAFLAAISSTDAADAFDIGSNVGVFSIMAAALTTTRVTAFEPTPSLVATFRAVARLNALACTVEPIAVGREAGEATLYLSSASDSSNSLRTGFRQATGTVTVPVERLDDAVTRLGRTPSVIKLDTESTEPDVLAGAPELLRVTRPLIVCEVLAGRTEAGLMAALRPLGYRFHHIGPDEPLVESARIVGDPTYAHRDWLFSPGPLDDAFHRHYRAWRATLGA
jgi:FkbM family methyltransferase